MVGQPPSGGPQGTQVPKHPLAQGTHPAPKAEEGVGRRAEGLPRSFCAAAVLLLICLFHVSAQTTSRAKQVCSQADEITRQLTVISGMTLLHPVPCDLITKEKVNEFLKKRLKEAVKPEEIHAEELVLKKFGLVPQDFNLEKTTVDLLTEQAAAFYDYNRRKLFITETTSSATQEPVLAHELSHALADQHFNLARFIKKGRESDDGSTARLAVMEGQATWIMTEYVARSMGQSLRDSPGLAAAMSAMTEGAGGQFPVYDTAPLYLRQSLVFPYTKGMLFQNALVQRDGQKGFAEPFARPPVSSQQILHPEKYLSEVKPTRPELPRVQLPRGYKSLIDGTMGESDHSTIIEQFASKEAAAEISPHWRGCRFEIRENKKEGRAVLLYAVEWDSENAAIRYFDFYKSALEKKWKSMKVQEQGLYSISGTGDDGRFELRRAGAIVTSAEGMP